MEDNDMADMKYALEFVSGEIMNVSLYKSRNGYNYASVGIKKGKDQYMNINYEWEGDVIPDFVMDMTNYFGQAPVGDKAMASVKNKQEFSDFLKRFKESTETI